MVFRRSFDRADDAQIRRKIIMLIGTIILVVFLINFAWKYSQKRQPNLITVEMINRNHFIIESDTTNYENFASTLKQAVIKAKKQYPLNQIRLTLPSQLDKSNSIADILMIVNSIDIDWKIKNK